MSNEDPFAGMTAAEIQQLLVNFGGDSGFEDYGTDYDFGYGGAPSMSQMIQPSVDYFTTKGSVNLGDLGQEAKRVNLLQDYGSLSVDNILSGYAGGGAYDVGAFTPTYDYGSPVNLPGRRKAESLAGSGGWQGFVTDLIMNEGMSPAEAEATLYKVIETDDNDPDVSEADRAKKTALIASMKPLMAAETKGPATLRGDTGASAATTQPYDSDTIRQFTTNVWSDLMEDPEFKYQDPDTGLYYDKTPEEAMVKTPQMMAYDKFGIPYPTATYEDPKYMEEFTAAESGGAGAAEREAMQGDWQSQQAARAKARTDARTGEVRSYDAAGDLEKAFAESQAQQRPMTEWDAVMQAAQSGGDQAAARAAFLGGGATPAAAGPVRGGGPALQPQQGMPQQQAGGLLGQRFADLGGASGPVPQFAQPAAGDVLGQRFQDLGGVNSRMTPDQASGVLGQRFQDLGGGAAPAAGMGQDEASEMLAQMFRDQGGVNDTAGPTFDFGGGPTTTGTIQGSALPGETRMISGPGPYSGVNRYGDRVLSTDASLNRRDPWDFGAMLTGKQGPIPTVRRTKQEDVTKQRDRAKAQTNKRSQAANAEFRATYDDPRMAAVRALARAAVLSQAGQTPFRDAMQARDANARAMLSGG